MWRCCRGAWGLGYRGWVSHPVALRPTQQVSGTPKLSLCQVFCRKVQPWAPDSLSWPFLGSLLSVLDSSPAFREHGVCTLVAFDQSSSPVTHYIPNPDLNPSQVQVGFWFQMSQLKPNLLRNFPHWEPTVCQLLGSVLWGCQREGGLL